MDDIIYTEHLMTTNTHVDRSSLIGLIRQVDPEIAQHFECVILQEQLSVPVMNQIIRYELIKLPIPTNSARDWLFDNNPPDVWVDVFMKKILPYFERAKSHIQSFNTQEFVHVV